MIIPVFDELKTAIVASGLPVAALARESGVARKTIHGWLKGGVFMPRVSQMVRVASVVGRHVELTETVAKMVRFYPDGHG